MAFFDFDSGQSRWAQREFCNRHSNPPLTDFSARAAYNLSEDDTVSQSEIIFSVQESPEGGYEARALGYSIFTQADILEELKTMLRDAVACHFTNGDKPSVIRLHMVNDEVIPA